MSDYDAYLFARLRGDARSIPLLGGLPLPMVAQACEVLGRDLFSAQESRPAIDTIPALQAARRKGFSILAAGPSELWNYFDHRLNGAGLVNLSGINLTALYGGLYQWLRRQTDLCLDPLRDLVADHASAKLPLPAGASVCSRILPVRRRHTIRTAAADFHSRPAMMRTWLIAEKVLPASPSRPAETAMIPETPAATAFLETARDAVTHRQASRILKINSDRLDELISGQIVRPIFSTITDPTQNAYARTELTTLLDQIISGSSTRFTSSTPDITYARATKVARQARCTFPDVVRLMITDQTVRAFRNPNEAGIHAIYVSVEDVKNAIHMAPLPGLTPWRFAQTLNITQRDFQQMEGLSLVWTKLVRHPALNGPIAIVPNACIKAFQRRYISLQALAARSRRHWIVERKRLNAYGFEPVYDGPTQRSRFYELSPKLKHLLKQPSL
ncbi:hypothetical protein ASF08_17090 [Methylobacterium sp. Leaf85]|nr:hypothetical protein ASF08_17090 [Methylobacterium sp. Leaf85]